MRGVVLGAYQSGNGSIPYGELAVLCACHVRKHLDVDIHLFVDADAESALVAHADKLDRLRVRLIRDDIGHRANLRQFAGSNGEPDQFNNEGRSRLYWNCQLDEMLFLDTDYLLYESSLGSVWDSPVPIRMNRWLTSVRYPNLETLSLIGNLTIPLYWATVAYFRRSPETDRFFKLVEYAKANYQWFSHVYRYEPRLYRNDYTFSIAAHILGGQSGINRSVGNLPGDVRFAWDSDEILGYYPRGLIVNASDAAMKRDVVVTRDQSIHVLNKMSLIPHLPKMIEQAWSRL